MIYVSTSGIKKKISLINLVKLFNDNEIYNIELSGGKYEKDIYKKLKIISKYNNIIFHNYFPVPKKPFVINLASNDHKKRKLSINHVKNSIKLLNKLHIKTFSVHGGFLFDPPEKKLGKNFMKIELQNRNKCIEIFVKSLKELSLYAKKYNVEILLENNVLTKENYSTFGANPFLMVDYIECLKIMKKTPKNINMLVDVGHLKVSAKTLKFSKRNFIINCRKWIKAYHLSDNDGYMDTNNAITKNSWFIKLIASKKIKFYSLEIKHKSFDHLIKQINLLKNFI